MRRRYLISAAVVLLSVCLCIWLISNPRWIIDYRKDGYVEKEEERRRRKGKEGKSERRYFDQKISLLTHFSVTDRVQDTAYS